MPKTFNIKAGAKAIQHIKEKGLSPNDISVIPAAAGGPKWIILYAFDQYLLKHWFQDRQKPLHLVGASAGAWRMLCYTLPNPEKAFARFLKAYTEQSYDTWPTQEEVTQKVIEIVETTLGQNGIDALLNEQIFKLNIVSTKTNFKKKLGSKYRRKFLPIVLKNSISRNLIRKDFERVIFTNSSNHNVIKKDGFKSIYQRFTKTNAISAIRSTGTLPIYMNPADDIEALDGLIWDGALIDYHIGLDYNTDGLVFYPHFADTLIEGWFDKFLPWRKFNGSVLDRMILISPSKTFVESLPDAKIPTREDFETYFDNKDQRIEHWYEAANRGEEMAAEFHALWESGNLVDHVLPLE